MVVTVKKQTTLMKYTLPQVLTPLAASLLLGMQPIIAQEGESKDAASQPELSIEETTSAHDNFVIPNPGELLQAASANIDLKAIVEKIKAEPVAAAGSDAILAHSLGQLLADGFISLHAKDAARTRAIGKQLFAVGEKLGADELILAEGKKIGELVDGEKWSEASTAADSFRTKLLVNLAKDGDVDLITIISASGWLHGFSLIAEQIQTSYNEDASKQLRQSELAAHLAARVAKLPEGRVKDAAKAAAALSEIAKLTKVEQEAAISKESLQAIATAAKNGFAALEGIENKK